MDNAPAKPLRPLTAHAREVLRDLDRKEQPAQAFNPGVIDRLLRGELITIEPRPSPYMTHRGRNIPFAVIAEAGRAEAKKVG
ncbi:hypothetical protein KIKIMORA_02020 [Brevundimonas phage vB_BpoS-Kikimora]|uniref:Uncharacterized protein n=1 Tax=Brevundimonas phage vB_BpoS-Kikimora TaxID=2948601 RepID=A0A9E7MRL1_9CAUD|nr:hypothetical protein KIKIMORA_02020 [Brevundimonas phage vB_BpoS-Kikimora]